MNVFYFNKCSLDNSDIMLRDDSEMIIMNFEFEIKNGMFLKSHLRSSKILPSAKQVVCNGVNFILKSLEHKN